MTKRKIHAYVPAVALCLLCSCGGQEKKCTTTHSVEVTTPVRLGNSITRSYSGTVREANEISLGFKTAGQIEHIYANEGDHVKKGELLASLDDSDYKLGVEALQIQYDQLADEVGRTRRLYEQKSVSANDYEKATAGLEQLGVQLKANQKKLEYTKLYAPADGVIQSVNFSKAEMVDAGTPMFTFLDISHLEVKTDITTDAYRHIGSVTDYSCRTTSDTGETRTYHMEFLSISPKADGNQLYSLRLKFKDMPDRQITPGMNIEVLLTFSNNGNETCGMSVPAGAVFKSNDTTCVWVLKADSTVEKREVKVGKSLTGETMTVESGLDGTEQVVRAGVRALHDGEKVSVIEQPEKSNVGGLI